MEAFNNYVSPQSVLVKMENLPAEAELMAIPGVTRLELLAAKQCRIYFEGNNQITEHIITASVEKNWRLIEINLEKSQLDDVFKQLSTQSV